MPITFGECEQNLQTHGHVEKQEHIHLPAAVTCQLNKIWENRAYNEGIKCTPYEEMFGQPMKVGLKTSNLPDETIDDIRTEEELKENIDSIEHGNLPMENEAAEDAERSCEAGTM